MSIIWLAYGLIAQEIVLLFAVVFGMIAAFGYLFYKVARLYGDRE